MGALAGDAGAVWYNPAGLGSVARNQLDLQLSMATWQRRRVEAGLVSELDGERIETALDGSRTTIISPSTVFVRRLGAAVVGGGVFVSRDDVVDVAGRTSEATGNLDASSWAAIDVESARYHIGIATGFPVGSRVRIGAGLFGIYDSLLGDVSLALNAVDMDTGVYETAVQAAIRERSDRYGVQLSFGAQVDVAPGLSLGLVVRSPLLLLLETLESEVVATGLAGQVFDPKTRKRARPGLLEPTQIVLSVVYVKQDFGFYVEGDARHRLRGQNLSNEPGETDWLVDRRALFNARLGFHWDVSPAVRLGAGVFTDRNGQRPDDEPTTFDVDYYGCTLGTTFTQRIGLAERERVDELRLRTTVSLRYAFGTGDTSQLRVDPATAAIDTAERVDVRFHELYVMLGSGLQF